MKCFIKKSRLHNESGWGNGYVVLPKGHPYNGVHYNDIPINIHGGLTFSKSVEDLILQDWDELTPEDIGGWVIGFDTEHWGDSLKNWPVDALFYELVDLIRQL